MANDPNDDDKLREMTQEPQLPDLGLYRGPARAAPYALSRMAPVYSLLDAAKEIEAADVTLANVAGGKLSVIAEQMKRLREQAERVLARARRDAELHRAQCSFEKKAGGVYHLYEKTDGTRWFSMLAPEEWSRPQPQTYQGSYRLELDMSYSRLDADDDLTEAPPDVAQIRALLR
jgi:hypothetical protein